MNKQDAEIDLLSDHELDAIAGGHRNADGPIVKACLQAFIGAAPSAAAERFQDIIDYCS